MKEILVLCPFGVDKGLLSKAARLSGGELRALVPAGEAETAAEYGAGRIFELSAPEIGDESAFAAFLSETIRRWGSQIVLAPATVRMRNIMPMLAWQLDAGLTADCTALRMEGEQLIQTRPAFGNSLMADIRSLSEIQMATVGEAGGQNAGRANHHLYPRRAGESPFLRKLCTGKAPVSGGNHRSGGHGRRLPSGL